MPKFCPACGSTVQENLPFCKNCGAALDVTSTQKEIIAEVEPTEFKKSGRKIKYLVILLFSVIFVVAGLGYLFSISSLSVQSDPMGAGVYLDAEFKGVTPCVIHFLPPGTHLIEFRHDGYPPWQKNITSTLGRTEMINADLSDNIIPAVVVVCSSDEIKTNNTGATECIYKSGDTVKISGSAVRPHPKENTGVTISVYIAGTVSPLKTESVTIQSDNTYDLSINGTTLPSGNYNLVASLPSSQKSVVAFTIESQEDTNIRILRQIVEDYHKIHTYSLYDYFVCADMAQDVWNIVDTKGIRALLVAGNIDDPNAEWKDYNHVWVIAETAPQKWIALETTGGFLVYKKDKPNYYRGIFFENPKDLKTNMDLRRDYNNEIERFSTIVRQYNAKASEYNAASDYYNSLVDTYNKNYAGRALSQADYQAALTLKNITTSEQMKLVQMKGELDQITITYNNEKQIMDNITSQMTAISAKGNSLINS